MNAPRMMIEAQFTQLLQTAIEAQHPLQVSVSVPFYVFDPELNRDITRFNRLKFTNNAYISKYGEPANDE